MFNALNTLRVGFSLVLLRIMRNLKCNQRFHCERRLNGTAQCLFNALNEEVRCGA